jgi:uncharacterized protein YggE
MGTKNLILSLIFILITLYLIKVFDIAYPINIISTSKTSELAIVGEAKMEVVPDIAYVNLGIKEQGKKVEEVKEKINQVNNNLINYLKKKGIFKENIKTSNYSIYPNYDYNEGEKIIGYTGEANLTIKLKDFNLISSILDEVTKLGVNQIGGVNFVVDEPQKYRQRVREKAIENAKNEAQKLAKTLGIKLGKITNIVESSPQEPISYLKAMSLNDRQSSPTLEPGIQTITTTVTLYFEKK